MMVPSADETSRITTVLVVDDSSFMRKALTHMLESDQTIKVIDTAVNGRDALQKLLKNRPQVVLLDIEMPEMDGLTALAHIMSECPTPVLMLSGLNKREADLVLKSFDYGAVDFISKPSGVISYDIEQLRTEITTKVKAAALVDISRISIRPSAAEKFSPGKHSAGAPRKMVVIGASTGGPKALATVLSGLSRDIPAAVVVVQHMSKEFIPSLCARLEWESPLGISVASRGQAVAPGRVLIAPGGRHTLFSSSGGEENIVFSREKSVHNVYPSIDCTMEAAAKVYSRETLGVLLTGMGSDGAQGMQAIREAGGGTIAEHESTCIISSMPNAAINLGCVDRIIPLPLIARAIMRMVSNHG